MGRKWAVLREGNGLFFGEKEGVFGEEVDYFEGGNRAALREESWVFWGGSGLL